MNGKDFSHSSPSPERQEALVFQICDKTMTSSQDNPSLTSKKFILETNLLVTDQQILDLFCAPDFSVSGVRLQLFSVSWPSPS